MNSSIDVCRSLLESGAKQDPLTSESEKLKEVSLTKAGVPFHILPQVTPLLFACMAQAWDIALLLLSKGADPNTAASVDGDVLTPLFLAIKFDSIDVCRSLLESGAKQEPLTIESENRKEVRQAYPSLSFLRSHPCFLPACLKPGT